MNIVVILIGGNGTRMLSTLPKQFIKVNEKEIFIHTVEKFVFHSLIDRCVLVINENFKDDSVEVSVVPSYNIGKKFHPKENGWNGYIVKLNNISYYIAGDTDLNDDIKNIKCEVALVPVGGTYTMTYKEAAELINIIKPNLAIPTHFGSVAGEMGDGESFKSLINPDIQCEIITELF